MAGQRKKKVTDTTDNGSNAKQEAMWRVDDIATRFGVDISTVRLWIDHGLLKTVQNNGVVMIPDHAVKSFRLANRLRIYG